MAAQGAAIHDPTVRYPSDPMVRAAQAALAGAQANLRDARVDGTVESVALFGASFQATSSTERCGAAFARARVSRLCVTVRAVACQREPPLPPVCVLRTYR